MIYKIFCKFIKKKKQLESMSGKSLRRKNKSSLDLL